MPVFPVVAGGGDADRGGGVGRDATRRPSHAVPFHVVPDGQATEVAAHVEPFQLVPAGHSTTFAAQARPFHDVAAGHKLTQVLPFHDVPAGHSTWGASLHRAPSHDHPDGQRPATSEATSGRAARAGTTNRAEV